MSRKHFEAIAEALAVNGTAFGADTRHAHYVADVANALAATNDRFDFERFMKAAGVEADQFTVVSGPFTVKHVEVA